MSDNKFLKLPKLSRHITNFNEVMMLNPKFSDYSNFNVKQSSNDSIPKSIYISRHIEDIGLIDDIWKNNQTYTSEIKPVKKLQHLTGLKTKPIRLEIDMRCYNPIYASIDKYRSFILH